MCGQAALFQPGVSTKFWTPSRIQGCPVQSPCPTRQRRLVFENVSFHYNSDHDEAVLEEINLVIEPGQTVAFLGATGAGKSTLVNLVPRFYDVSAGRISVRRDRHPRNPAGLAACADRDRAPGNGPFSGTVSDNIRYGVPAGQRRSGCRSGQGSSGPRLHHELPKGYDTHVEERGVNLSGGQKQRIAIARALLTQPDDPDPRRQHQLGGRGDRNQNPGCAGERLQRHTSLSWHSGSALF